MFIKIIWSNLEWWIQKTGFNTLVYVLHCGVKIISLFLNRSFNIGNVKLYIYSDTARSTAGFILLFICEKCQQVQSCTYYFLGSSDFQLFLRLNCKQLIRLYELLENNIIVCAGLLSVFSCNLTNVVFLYEW